MHCDDIEQQVDVTNTDAVRRFVRESDKIGEPASDALAAYWKTVQVHRPDWLLARAAQASPLSKEYFDLQDQLYIFMHGTPYSEKRSEHTIIDKQTAVASHLAYPNRPPRELNKYMRAHAKFADHIDSELPCDVLEVGSGWGFSTEYLARLGHRVTGVDINPDFVEVASLRSERGGLGIDYRQGTFGNLPLGLQERFDLVYCFEAFHHARHSRETLVCLVERLRPKGQFILFGEPFIEESMWPSWGLRLDPLSIYCIAKFGWWESGWTRTFMGSLFRSAGLASRFIDENSDLERYMVGHITNAYNVDQLSYQPEADGWLRYQDYLVSGGNSRIEFYRSLSRVVFRIESFAPHPLWTRFESSALAAPVTVEVVPGSNRFAIPLSACPPTDLWEIRIVSQTWNPLRLLGVGDDRELSFHLSGLEECPISTLS